MGKLFIIGNGFDIDHDLETEYTDFLNYLGSDYQKAAFIDNIGQITDCSNEELWNQFEKNLGNLNIDILIEDAMVEREEFYSDYEHGFPDESYFNNHVTDTRISSLHKLDKYVKSWIETISLENVSLKRKYQNIFTEESFFINFNYTNTLQEVYDINNEKVFHIHGNVSSPIMGHGKDGDFHEPTDYPTFESNYVENSELSSIIVSEINDFYNNSRKDIHLFCTQMINFIDSINIEIDEVCIIGHSLGDVDSLYFYELSHYYGDIPWTIFSRHTEKDKISEDKEIKLKLLHQINNGLDADVVPYKE